MTHMQQQEQILIDTPFFKTANNIAKKLAKDAIWSDDGRCNWQGASTEAINGQFRIATRTFGPDLYNGLAGISLFLAEIIKRNPNPILIYTLNGAIKNIITLAKTQPNPSSFGYFTGKLGTGYTLWKIGRLLDNNEWRSFGLASVKALNKVKIGDFEIDIVSGVAGAIPALLKIYEIEKDDTFLDIAKRCGQFLIDKAIKSDYHWSWQTIPDNPGLTGYSHGAAGIGLAFVELYAITKDEAFYNAGIQSFSYEKMHFNARIGNWPDLRNNVVPPPNSVDKHVCGNMWCHGAPGIALSRIRLYQIMNNIGKPSNAEMYKHDIQIALSTTEKSVIDELQHHSNANFSLCHGLAGNADIMLTGGLELNIPSYINLAQQVGMLGIKLYEETGINWPSGVNDPSGQTRGMESTPGLMLGLAGTGYFYLRLAFPTEIENILLIK